MSAPTALTWPGVAPRARVSADERRASSTVAQVMSSALTADKSSSATVMTPGTGAHGLEV